MFLVRKPAPSRIIYKSQKEREILQQIDDFIESHTKEPVQILARLWEDQQNAIGYPELREAILTGQLDEKRIQTWMQDYSMMAAKTFAPAWLQAIKHGGAGQPITKELQGFSFQSNTKAIRRWVAERSATLVTAVTNEQKDAIKAMIGRAIDGKYTVDELSRVIRPCVGLTRPQAAANQRYYESVRDNLLTQHPRMKVESVQKKAREMALKYAEKQHRQRAYMIAETELASAYNYGNDQAVRQAQQQGRLGAVRRIGCTADDERVCSDCSDREGKELAEGDIPPWHPRCRCAILYEPTGQPLPDSQVIEEPDFIPIDNEISDDVYKRIQEEYSLIPPFHQDIMDKEIIEIRRSSIGNSYMDKRFGLIYIDNGLVKGEFIHEAGHFIEEYFGVFQDATYLKLLEDSLGDIENNLIYDTDTFVQPIKRVISPKLVSLYQGRYYTQVAFRLENGMINPYAFSDFFAESYKVYILNPNQLKEINPELFNYIRELSAYPWGWEKTDYGRL